MAEIVVYLTDRCSSQDKSKFQNAEFSMQVETTKKTKLTKLKKTPDIWASSFGKMAPYDLPTHISLFLSFIKNLSLFNPLFWDNCIFVFSDTKGSKQTQIKVKIWCWFFKSDRLSSKRLEQHNLLTHQLIFFNHSVIVHNIVICLLLTEVRRDVFFVNIRVY